jgi:hypothetical protein
MILQDTNILIVFLLIALPVFVFFALMAYLLSRFSEDWQPFETLFPRLLVDGTTSGGFGKLLMRRKINGQWQYRLPTETEELDWWEAGVW